MSPIDFRQTGKVFLGQPPFLSYATNIPSKSNSGTQYHKNIVSARTINRSGLIVAFISLTLLEKP